MLAGQAAIERELVASGEHDVDSDQQASRQSHSDLIAVHSQEERCSPLLGGGVEGQQADRPLSQYPAKLAVAPFGDPSVMALVRGVGDTRREPGVAGDGLGVPESMEVTEFHDERRGREWAYAGELHESRGCSLLPRSVGDPLC